MIQKLVLATHNKGKVREFDVFLKGLVGEVVCAGDIGLPEPEETGSSFEENALLKARAATMATGLPSLADDSGLAVNVLDGAPGIYSARWAGPDKDFSRAMTKVHETLGGAVDRSAAFVAVLALVYPDGREAVFEGRIEGELCWPPRGEKGFGYDPMFLPFGQKLTFGEMDAADKHAISHRARAVEKLVQHLKTDG